ncbi:MAG: hypothetical protein ETSY1_15610 [Candidatus Entotheonella factor]|uniref:Uncharacterized protein n=1 Tax=Entotheonella factor TaxID=1429438 RepID=W4LN04_ENTF1|nr:hypothetical protein [Candidatus Entotheonella palauensis]ETW99269.1 MAG: hypothetical protein ETSY1_15610 [Candidatus Entotheonella factor]
MRPKANPDVILHIPQTQFQAVQTRLTHELLQSQYAFVQSFSCGPETTFDILIHVDRSPVPTLESVQVALCPAMHGTSTAVTQDQSLNTAPPSDHMAPLIAHLVAVCTATPEEYDNE